jgi:hypothetical protein
MNLDSPSSNLNTNVLMFELNNTRETMYVQRNIKALSQIIFAVEKQ